MRGLRAAVGTKSVTWPMAALQSERASECVRWKQMGKQKGQGEQPEHRLLPVLRPAVKQAAHVEKSREHRWTDGSQKHDYK